MRYLLDSYALVAFFGASDERYRKYMGPGQLVSLLSLFETYYRLLERGGRENASRLYAALEKHFHVVGFDSAEVPAVGDLRYQARRRKKRWSYTDAANLYLARREGARLVTGDVGLRGEGSVEFVGPSRPAAR